MVDTVNAVDQAIADAMAEKMALIREQIDGTVEALVNVRLEQTLDELKSLHLRAIRKNLERAYAEGFRRAGLLPMPGATVRALPTGKK